MELKDIFIRELKQDYRVLHRIDFLHTEYE